ncbi:MAG: hypothetical protein ACTSRP_14565 [Candidatus Helarchaeota archaeon]
MVFDNWNIYEIIPDHVFKDKDILPPNLQVLHLPGHTPGHCGFKFENVIFSADIDLNKRGPVVSSVYSNIFSYKQSVNKLINIIKRDNIKILLPGHWNAIFSDIIKKLKIYYNEIIKKEKMILNILSKNVRMTIEDLTNETIKDFIDELKKFLTEDTKDSLLIARAAEIITNINYLNELLRLNKVKKVIINDKEYWEPMI